MIIVLVLFYDVIALVITILSSLWSLELVFFLFCYSFIFHGRRNPKQNLFENLFLTFSEHNPISRALILSTFYAFLLYLLFSFRIGLLNLLSRSRLLCLLA